MTEKTPIQTISSDDQLMNQFQQMNNKSDITEVIKELFDTEKIYLIGDLTKEEIKICTRIKMIAEMKKIPIWEKGLEFYCKILLSKDRKSRKEILDAVRGVQKEQGLLQKLNPFSRNG